MSESIGITGWMKRPATQAVMAALAAKGGPGCARFVGGCVRNALIGHPVDDIDIATTLQPEAVVMAIKTAGLKAVPTGMAHGTVTAISGGQPHEITTLRRDVSTDGRNATVAFTTDWAEDAGRRDFRLNALYAAPDGEVFDPTGQGIEDALAGRIVFVGEPETRIREDYLRILRFFRFHAWYGRGPADAAGLKACARLKDGMARLSAERVSKELLKLLAAPDPAPAVRLMAESGVLDRVLPDHAGLTLFESMTHISDDPLLRLSALLPADADRVRASARALRLSNAQKERLVLALPAEPAVTQKAVDIVETAKAPVAEFYPEEGRALPMQPGIGLVRVLAEARFARIEPQPAGRGVEGEIGWWLKLRVHAGPLTRLASVVPDRMFDQICVASGPERSNEHNRRWRRHCRPVDRLVASKGRS